jgi:poly-gamma-glutamate synthesis protein (capsule biosynthesis protein)
LVVAGLLLLALATGCTGPAGGKQIQPPATAAPAPPATNVAGAPPTTGPRGSVTLAFGGDVHFEGASGARLAAGPRAALDPIAPVLRRADLAVVNLETAITERGTPAPKEFNFRAPPSAFTALAAAGVDVASMANNHGMDYGQVGLRDSLAAARSARFPVVGIGRDATQAFRPHTVEINGWRIALLGATQVIDSSLAAAWSAGDGKPGLASAQGGADRLRAAVAQARKAHDTVVVFLHWGQEGNQCPLERQQTLAQALVDAGADVIVGSHAHVLLGGGSLGDAYVHYGLGNFVFYARGGASARTGVLELTVRGRQVERARWRPAEISGGVPRPLDGPAAARALDQWQALRDCTGLEAGPG